MTFPIDQFEHFIEEGILERGHAYFRKGKIQITERSDSGGWMAEVEGSGEEDYEVHLKVEEGNVTAFRCSCPYDRGPICKHVVALLFEIQQEVFPEFGTVAPKWSTDSKGSKKGKVQRKTPLTRAKDLLVDLSIDELKEFLLDRIQGDPLLCDNLLSKFSHKEQGLDKADHVAQLHALFRKYEDKHGFIHRGNAGQLTNAVFAILESAQSNIRAGKLLDGIAACQAVIEEMYDTMQYADDSDGAIGGTVEQAIHILADLSLENMPEEIRTMLIDYCQRTFRSGRIGGFDFHYELIRVAVNLVRDQKEAQDLRAIIEAHPRTEWAKTSLLSIIADLVLKTEGDKAAYTYMRGHLDVMQFRSALIDKAIESGQFDDATELAQGGLIKDARSAGYLVHWQLKMLDIALARGARDEVIERAKALYLDGSGSENDLYRLMKKYVPETDWQVFIEGLAVGLMASKKWPQQERYAELCIREEWTERLLNLVKQNPSFHQISRFEKPLAKAYPKEVAQLYADAVNSSMIHNVGRSHYKEACRILRRVIKLGEHELAMQVAADLRQRYPQRRALMEELEKL